MLSLAGVGSIAKRLKALINGPSPFDKASALYALGEISANLRAKDDVAFRTTLQLQVFLDKAEQMMSHANPMVRRRALPAGEIRPEKTSERTAKSSASCAGSNTAS